MSNFCLKARSQNGCGFQRSRLKTGVENDIVWSQIGSGLGEPGGTSPPRIPRRTPRLKRCFSNTESQRINESTETSIESNVVMTLLLKIINLMANLKIFSDALLALQMLYEGKGGGGEFGENDELGTVSKFNIIPVTSK